MRAFFEGFVVRGIRTDGEVSPDTSLPNGRRKASLPGERFVDVAQGVGGLVVPTSEISYEPAHLFDPERPVEDL